jgi:predicted MFS family arabinose efflux permease
MTLASAVAVANIYYNQPMLADMGRTFHASARDVGWVATATQIGYAAGMPAFIPLGDFLDRRRLVVLLFIAVAAALAFAAVAPNLALLAIASFLIGVTTVIAQILIPLATELSAPGEQGRTIGWIMSGILLGILLARTVSGTVAHYFGWRTMFGAAAVTALVFAFALQACLPALHASVKIRYRELMRGIWDMVRELPKLRQVSFIAAMFFAAFSAFWTTLVFLLEKPPYHYGSEAAGLFGLVGAVGASVAPLAGRYSDRRTPRFVVRIAIGTVVVAFALFWASSSYLWGLIVGVILLDAGVQAAQVANQSRILSLRPEARNRVNTVYMVSYFGGGSLGSLGGAWMWSEWHWSGVCILSIAFMVAATVSLSLRGPNQ